MESGEPVQSGRDGVSVGSADYGRRGRSPVARAVIDLVEVLREVERALSEKHGPFELFGLFRRRRGVGWDIVAAAPWFTVGLRPTIEAFIDELKRVGGPEVTMRISRILVMPDPQFLEAVHSVVTVEHGMEVVGPGEYGNVEIARGYVITSRPLAPAPAGVAADAVPT